MKTMIVGLLAVVMGLMVSDAMAGSGCCPKTKAAPKACTMAECQSMVNGLDLSADQKAQLEALSAKCEKIGCPKTAMSEWQSGLSEVLTEEQAEVLQQSCSAKNVTCPMMKKKGCSAAN